MTIRHFALLLVLGLVSALQVPQAQGVQGQGNQGADRNPLARVKSLKCTFTVSMTGTWKSDEAQGQVKGEELVLNIEGIDAQEGTAHLPGAPGDITAVLTANSLHFLDRSFLGNLTVMTVFNREGPKGKFRAVRSRHDFTPINIPGLVTEPTVTQTYGSCEAGQ